MTAQQKPQASTQEHLVIEDIRDGLVLLKDGGAALVLQTTAVNFGLLSEEEQDATIFAFAGLLNSLNFTIQIVIRSKKLDISSYLALVDQYIQKQKNDDLKKQMQKYKEFVAVTIAENKVLDKRFYLAIPFLPTELGLKAIKGIFNTPKKLPYSKEYILEQAKTALLPKRDHVIKQLSRIGLRAQQLSDQKLVELFYDIYNPAQIGMAKLSGLTQEYTSPTLVEPAVAMPPALGQTQSAFGQTKSADKPAPVNPPAAPLPKPEEPKVEPQPKIDQEPPAKPMPESQPLSMTTAGTATAPKLSTTEQQAVEEALKKLAEAAAKLPSSLAKVDVSTEDKGKDAAKNLNKPAEDKTT